MVDKGSIVEKEIQKIYKNNDNKLRERKKIKKPHSLAQVSEHFLHNFLSQFSSICTMQGQKSHAPSQRRMTSPSRDPMRPGQATFMGAQR